MKPCKFCGAELPEEALFCPCCESEQVEKKLLRLPRPRRRKRWIALLFALVLLLFGAWILHRLFSHEPQVYNAGAPLSDMEYVGQDGVCWRLFLSLDRAEDPTLPCAKLHLAYPEGGEGEFNSLLYAVPEGGTAADGAAFLKLLDHVEIIAAEVDHSEAMVCGEPAFDPAFPLAVSAVTLRYNTRTFINELGWVLYLKNGDVIYMHQYLTVDNGARTYNAGAPALDMQYPAENGVTYRLFLTFARSKAEAKPEDWSFFPLLEGRQLQIVSHLCAIPEGGTLEDGASFTDLIQNVEIRVADIHSGSMLLMEDQAFAPRCSFAAATVAVDYDETWQEAELAWCIRMRSGDVIYMHQFVNVGNPAA